MIAARASEIAEAPLVVFVLHTGGEARFVVAHYWRLLLLLLLCCFITTGITCVDLGQAHVTHARRAAVGERVDLVLARVGMIPTSGDDEARWRGAYRQHSVVACMSCRTVQLAGPKCRWRHQCRHVFAVRRAGASSMARMHMSSSPPRRRVGATSTGADVP